MSLTPRPVGETCLRPAGATQPLCANCRSLPPTGCHLPCLSGYWLLGPLAQAIAAAKFRGQAALWPALGQLLWQSRSVRNLLTAADAITFVPSHRRRLAERGYEHAGLLASWLSQRANRPLLPGLHKIRATPPQSSLERGERQRALTGAFVGGGSARGRKLVVIDDVRTTGATLAAAAAALYAAGAQEVTALCLASTP